LILSFYILLTSLYVGYTLASSQFVEQHLKDSNRAKLFELSDYTLPVIKVNIPENELDDLKIMLNPSKKNRRRLQNIYKTKQ